MADRGSMRQEFYPQKKKKKIDICFRVFFLYCSLPSY